MRALALSKGLICGALLSATPALCDPIEDFYRGRQVSLVLSTGAGGGYASYGHAFAPFFTKHIPGNPNIVVQNMPGAGGIRAMQFFNTVAPRDGSVLGLVHSSVPFAPLYGIKGATFDPRAMNWIGSINSSEAICVSWAASGVTQWKDLYDKTYIVGGTGAGSQMETMPAMINKLFGTKIKIISGYTGGNDVYLAMERGEVHGRGSNAWASYKATQPDWLKDGKINLLAQIGLAKDPELPNVPLLMDLGTTPEDRAALKLLSGVAAVGRPLVMGPAVPPERVAALRRAFDLTVKDPAYIAELQKINLPLNAMGGEELQKIVTDMVNTPKPIVERLIKAIEGRDVKELAKDDATKGGAK